MADSKANEPTKVFSVPKKHAGVNEVNLGVLELRGLNRQRGPRLDQNLDFLCARDASVWDSWFFTPAPSPDPRNLGAVKRSWVFRISQGRSEILTTDFIDSPGNKNLCNLQGKLKSLFSHPAEPKRAALFICFAKHRPNKLGLLCVV